jgi:ribonuclease HI
MSIPSFQASNNVAECEALVNGLHITVELGHPVP